MESQNAKVGLKRAEHLCVFELGDNLYAKIFKLLNANLNAKISNFKITIQYFRITLILKKKQKNDG